MSICGKCIHYEICDEYVSPCETFPETENGCPCYKSKDDFSEVKHGEYHNTRFTDGVFYQEQCSICGEWTYEYDKKYCPHCGAKMDGERRAEE